MTEVSFTFSLWHLLWCDVHLDSLSLILRFPQWLTFLCSLCFVLFCCSCLFWRRCRQWDEKLTSWDCCLMNYLIISRGRRGGGVVVVVVEEFIFRCFLFFSFCCALMWARWRPFSLVLLQLNFHSFSHFLTLFLFFCNLCFAGANFSVSSELVVSFLRYLFYATYASS